MEMDREALDRWLTTDPVNQPGSDPTLDDEDTSQLVSNEDIANAARAHLKMASWVQVAVVSGDEPADPGKWSIRTTDIAANGQWYVDGQNLDGTPHIDILMEEFASEGTPSFPYASMVEVKVSRGTTTDKESDEEVDGPSDDDVVELVNCVKGVDRQWDGVKAFVRSAIQNGDPEFCKEARDLLPGLIVNIGNLMTALNRAVERAEEPHT